jgi:ligand-binding sensor domain-containing protein
MRNRTTGQFAVARSGGRRLRGSPNYSETHRRDRRLRGIDSRWGELLLLCIAVLSLESPLACFANGEWTPIGPDGGAPINILISDHTGVLYAETQSGVFKLPPKSTRWLALNRGLARAPDAVLAMDTSGALYAGTGSIVFKLASGSTWHPIGPGLPGSQVTHLALDKSGTLYARTNAGVFRLPVGGTSWETASFGLPLGIQIYSLLSDESGALYAHTSDGFFKVTNGSIAWTFVAKDPPPCDTCVAGFVGFAVDTAGALFVAFAGSDTFYKLPSGVAAWERLLPLPASDPTRFWVGSDGTLIVGSQSGILFRLSPDGTSWRQLGPSLKMRITAIDIDPSGRLSVGTPGGVFILSSDEKTWEHFGGGMWGPKVSQLVTGSSGNLYAGSDSPHGVFKMGSAGTSWEAWNTGLGSLSIQAMGFDPEGSLCVSTIGGLYRLLPGESTWKKIPTEFGQSHVTTLRAGPDGAILAGAQNGKVYRSSSCGRPWQQVGKGLQRNSIQALGFDIDGNLYAGSHGVSMLAKGASRWLPIGRRLKNPWIGALAIDANGTLYAGTFSGIFTLLRGKKRWQDASAGMAEPSGNAFAWDTRGNLYAATNAGVYRLAPGSRAWKLVGPELAQTSVLSLAFDRNGALYAGTYTGVYKLSSLPSTSADDEH